MLGKNVFVQRRNIYFAMLSRNRCSLKPKPVTWPFEAWPEAQNFYVR